MVNYKVNTENLSLDAYKKNAFKKIIQAAELPPCWAKNIIFEKKLG